MADPIPPPGVARIRSIPTTYNGVQMRSRLEADWARFFDRWQIRWAYESEGFDLDGLWYLPDFWLPDIRTIVEVKGIMDGASEEKIRRLAQALLPDSGQPEPAGTADIMLVVAEAPAGQRFTVYEYHNSPASEPTFGRCRNGHAWFYNEEQDRNCRHGCPYEDRGDAWPSGSLPREPAT